MQKAGNKNIKILHLNFTNASWVLCMFYFDIDVVGSY